MEEALDLSSDRLLSNNNMLHLFTSSTTGFTLRHWSADVVLPGFGVLMSFHRQEFPLPHVAITDYRILIRRMYLVVSSGILVGTNFV